MKRILLPLTILFCFTHVNSQKQANNWFFAQGNGINFSSGAPVNISGGQIQGMEGSSAISDSNGVLLFYTDGVRVWDKFNSLMPNGTALAGGSVSSTQSSIIVPKTPDGKQYYIFTADEEGGPRGLQYSVVDMTLNSGKGDVATLNVPLVAPTSEKVTAVRHCNKKDYWVITHQYNSDAYYAYLVTSTGVNPIPVISHTGSFIPIAFATMAGALKSSPDCKRLVAAHGQVGLELMDFDNQTGQVSNAVEIFGNSNSLPYGAEFSSNSLVLYAAITHYWDAAAVTRFSGVFQFDLSQATIAGIINSKLQLSQYPQGNEMGQMQRAPDGKIYMSQYRKNYLSVIHAPNVVGTGCNFVTNGFTLPSQGLFSLANLVNDYGTMIDSFTVANGSCVNLPVQFNYTPISNVTSVKWDFGDPLSGFQNQSTSLNPTHTFAVAGNYNVQLIKYGNCGNDTLTKPIKVGDLYLNLGNDTSICEQTQYLINPQVAGVTSYLWQDGSAAPTFFVSSPGLYWVQASNNTNGCIRRDSILVTTKPLPIVDLGKDTSLCVGSSLLLNAFNTGSSYLWQNNTINPTLSANQSGLYWVRVTKNGCSFTDSIRIGELSKPVFSLGADQSICTGQQVQLQLNLPNVKYLWQDGSSGSSFNVTNDGVYFVDVTNQCGTTRDSIVFVKTECTVYVPSAFTPNNDGKNDYFQAYGTGNVTEFELNVYNRWGQLVFKTKDKSRGWDGALNGMPQPGSVYVWTIKFKTAANPNTQFMKGSVALIR